MCCSWCVIEPKRMRRRRRGSLACSRRRQQNSEDSVNGAAFVARSRDGEMRRFRLGRDHKGPKTRKNRTKFALNVSSKKNAVSGSVAFEDRQKVVDVGVVLLSAIPSFCRRSTCKSRPTLSSQGAFSTPTKLVTRRGRRSVRLRGRAGS